MILSPAPWVIYVMLLLPLSENNDPGFANVARHSGVWAARNQTPNTPTMRWESLFRNNPAEDYIFIICIIPHTHTERGHNVQVLFWYLDCASVRRLRRILRGISARETFHVTPLSPWKLTYNGNSLPQGLRRYSNASYLDTSVSYYTLSAPEGLKRYRFERQKPKILASFQAFANYRNNRF